MNTLWVKAWADLWLYKTRTLLAISSIAIGLFCVGTLFGMIDLLLTKMDQAHQLSSPSDIKLILKKPVNTTWLSQIKQFPGVAGVDSMSQTTVRYQLPADSKWLNAIMMARPQPDHHKFDKSTLVSGAWPEKDQLAIEQMSAQKTGITPGDTITIQTYAGIKSLQISGIIRHPFIKPPKFGGQVHFFIDSMFSEPFGTPINSFRQLLLKTTSPYSADKTTKIAAEITKFLLQNNIGINASLLQDPEKHWGRPFIAGVTGVLEIMAMAALVLAGVLIFNTLSAHIMQQTHLIGVMKAIGASSSRIAAVYFAEVMFMTVIAIVVAVPLSLAAAYISSCQLLSLFNINCTDFDYSQYAVIVMLCAGILMPILAATVPIWRGSRLTVRQAIASYGLGSDFKIGRLDIYLERFIAQFLPTLFAATLGNLFRRKYQAILTQTVLVIAGVLFMVLMSLIASLQLTLDNENARSRYALQLGFQGVQDKYKTVALAESVPATEEVEVWQRLAIQMSANQQVINPKGSLGAELLAIPAASRMYKPLIEQGRWLEAEDAGQRVVVISADTAKINNLKLADKLTLQFGPVAMDCIIIGFYRWLVTSNFNIEPVYLPLETLKSVSTRDDIASLLLLDAEIASREAEADYVSQLEQVFQDHLIPLNPYNTRAKIQQRQFAVNQFKPVISTLSGLAIMIASVGGISLSGILLINVLQRRREIGVLSAIGAKPGTIFRMFLAEGMLYGVFAWLISVPIAYYAAQPIAKKLGETMFGMQLDYRFDIYSPAYWFCLICIIALLASYWPAKKATTVSVAESLEH